MGEGGANAVDLVGGIAPQLLEELDVARLQLPAIADGVDLGSLYELAEALAAQGVR